VCLFCPENFRTAGYEACTVKYCAVLGFITDNQPDSGLFPQNYFYVRE